MKIGYRFSREALVVVPDVVPPGQGKHHRNLMLFTILNTPSTHSDRLVQAFDCHFAMNKPYLWRDGMVAPVYSRSSM